MNLRQRSSRYGPALLFTAGLTAIVIVAAAIRAGFAPQMEIWLGAALVLTLILHARMGFALSRAQLEIEMLRKLVGRVKEDPAEAIKKISPILKVGSETEISPEDAVTLERVRSAIEGGRLELYLQPIVSLPQRKVRFFEAFSRLREESGRVLRPYDYLEAAERTNRIGVIDNLILLRCVQALRHLARTDAQYAVFCNLSPATLFDTDFFNHFTDYLEMNADLSGRLIFEFAYPAAQLMHPRFEENLRCIARRGFAFSVDHVHTLDLDWQSLRRRNFQFVKAPSSLLLAANKGNTAAVEQLAAFRKRLADAGISLIAEKIEFESHMPEILALGIDFGQGNLFGPPRPAEMYMERLQVEDDTLAKAS